MPLRTSVVSPKYLYIRCAQIGLGRGAREGVYPQRYSTDRATKPQANFSATRRAACLLGGGVVARSLSRRVGTGYARRSRLASVQNPLPRMYRYYEAPRLVVRPIPARLIGFESFTISSLRLCWRSLVIALVPFISVPPGMPRGPRTPRPSVRSLGLPA